MLSRMKFNIVNDKRGVALATVVIIFAVITIMAATMATLVYSDTKFGADNENGKKAYYAARSAVDTVESVILNNLADLQDEKGEIIKDIEDSVNALNEAFETGDITTQEEYSEELDNILDGFQGRINNYKANYNYFRNNILPSDSPYEHVISIDGFEADSPEFTVKVTPIPSENTSDGQLIGAFKLETEATINKKTKKVAKWVGIEVRDEDKLSVSTLKKIVVEEKNIFDYAIYSYGDITFGEGGGGGTILKVFGPIGYEGELYNGTHVNATHTPVPQPKTPMYEIPEPASIIPVDVNELPERKNALPQNISSADNGYYSQHVKWDKKYQVNTASGDVVLKFSSVELTKDYRFTVTGGNNLYIYIYDEKNPGVDFNTDKAQINNETPMDGKNGSKIFFIVDQPESQRDVSKNEMKFDLGKNSCKFNNLYVYAPYTNLLFNNKLTYSGSIVAGGFRSGNAQSVITHIASADFDDDDDDEDDNNLVEGDPIDITISGVESMKYKFGSFWL